MKKFFSLLLLAGTCIGINTAFARGENNKATKPGITVNETSPGDADPKLVTAKNEKGIPSADSAFVDPDFHFYTPKKKRSINLQDIYVGVGIGYLEGKGRTNAPYNSGLSLSCNYGVPLLNKYLLFEFSNNADFLFAPNMDWFSNAMALRKSQIRGVGLSFNDEFSIGLNVVIVGTKKVTFTAGPVAGAKLTILPSTQLSGKSYYLSVPLLFCYGMKTNLFIGEHFYCYAQYSNTTTSSLISYTSQPGSEITQGVRHIPVDFGALRMGVGYVIKPWW